LEHFDFIVIGAGIAGASAAYALAEHGRVLVLERESQPGYHTTGRSAALFTENYGNRTIRRLERVEAATIFQIRRLTHRWAGLRSFVADNSLVIGETPDAKGFFWLAGQGGYGIQTSPAAGAALGGLVTTGELPSALRETGLSPADLSPHRPGIGPMSNRGTPSS